MSCPAGSAPVTKTPLSCRWPATSSPRFARRVPWSPVSRRPKRLSRTHGWAPFVASAGARHVLRLRPGRFGSSSTECAPVGSPEPTHPSIETIQAVDPTHFDAHSQWADPVELGQRRARTVSTPSPGTDPQIWRRRTACTSGPGRHIARRRGSLQRRRARRAGHQRRQPAALAAPGTRALAKDPRPRD